MTLFLTESDVNAVFDWSAAVGALRAAYAAPQSAAFLPPRSMARGDGFWLRTLTGILPGGRVMGTKQIAASVRGRRASYLISLFDQETMELIALLDGNAITGYRTAATSALAANTIAADGARDVAVIGTGFEAQKHLRALLALRPASRIAVFSPREESRQHFANGFKQDGIEVVPMNSAESAVRIADIVICAARSRDETPILKGDWLSAGATVVSIGSTLPEQREVDPETIARACLIVCDMVHEVANDTGDMIAAQRADVAFEHKLLSLADVVAQRTCARNSLDDIILYKSVGSALQDLAVAHMCVERARECGIGTTLPVSTEPVKK